MPSAASPDADAPSAPAIGALGSCRIHTPLHLLADRGLVRHVTDKAIGYVHNPLELAQALMLLRGHLTPPDRLRPLINIVGSARLGQGDRFATAFGSIDLMMIEISSARIIAFDGWQLQINRFRELVRPFGVEEREVGRLFAGPQGRLAILNRLADSSGDEAAFARRIVEEGHFHELRGTALFQSVAALRHLLPMPVVFVALETARHDGTHVPQRAEVVAAIERASRAFPDTHAIDPTPLVLRHGVTAFMKDLGHYRPENEPVVADYLYEALRAIPGLIQPA